MYIRIVLFAALLVIASPSNALESVLAFSDPTDDTEHLAAFAGLHYFAGNDPLSIHAYQGNWQGAYHPRDGRNLGLLSQRAESSLQTGGWRLSVFERQEALIDSSRSTTDLYRLYKSLNQAASGQMYVVDASYQAFAATGLRLDKAWRWKIAENNELALGVGYSRLEGHRVKTESANGIVTSLGAGKYSYALKLNDSDTRKTYPYQTSVQQKGDGDAWDLGLSFKTDNGPRFDLLANDILANIRWRDVPSSIATANTGVTSTDANGYIVYAPALSGRNFSRNFTQPLPTRYAASAALPWREFSVFGSLTRQQGISFPMAGATWAYAENWRLQADFDTRFGSAGLKLTGPLAFLALRTSQWNLSETRAYGLSAGMHWAFDR
jgi:hypothetical protein